MNFDTLTLACITDELRTTLCPGRVQQVLLVDDLSIGLELYAHSGRAYLLCCLHPTTSRVHLVSQKLRRGPEQQTPLLMLLRKYVREAMLNEVRQPNPTERILYLHFQHLEHGATTLVVEPMGRLSNLLLLNKDGMILECMNRVRAGEHAQRVLLPGRPYVPPPVQKKLPPVDDGSAEYYTHFTAILQGQPAAGKAPSAKLWKALVDSLAGVSPTLGREVAWQATGDCDALLTAADPLAVAAALQELWRPVQEGGWQPGVWQEAGRVVGFSPYPAHLHGAFVPTASISAAVEQFYTAQAEGVQTQSQEDPSHESVPQKISDAYSAQRGQVLKLLQETQKRIARQLAGVAADEPKPGEVERIRSQAEWLLALHHQVQPGQSELVVDLEEAKLLIPLDANKTPVQQAQDLFKRATRLARAAVIIPQRRSQLQNDLAFVEQLLTDLRLASNQPEIAAVRQELSAAGLLFEAQGTRAVNAPQVKTGQPHSFVSPSGFTILIGKNARQNEEVTFHKSHPQDIWLHVRNVPGAHVIIRNSGRPVDAETLTMAAQLAAYHSSQRLEKAVEVIYSERRFVQHAPGGRPGQVTVRNERVMTVRGEMPEGGEGEGVRG